MSTAVALARVGDGSRHFLFLVDQYPSHKPFYEAIKRWGKHSPFIHTDIFFSSTGGISKFLTRKKFMQDIRRPLDKIIPAEIICSNDRRMEFQFAMHYMKQKTGKYPIGSYIDDGLFSYLGRKSNVVDKYIDTLLKKLFYGFWWNYPPTVGASSLIDNAWLIFPEQAIEPLREKKVKQLNELFFCSENVQELARILCERLDIYLRVNQHTKVLLLLLPHSSVVDDVRTMRDALLQLAHSKYADYKVCVKSHPRDDFDKWGFGDDVELISQAIPSELLLPFLPQDRIIMGPISTSLLTAKWLLPMTPIYYINTHLKGYQNISVDGFMNSLGIKQLESPG